MYGKIVKRVTFSSFGIILNYLRLKSTNQLWEACLPKDPDRLALLTQEAEYYKFLLLLKIDLWLKSWNTYFCFSESQLKAFAFNRQKFEFKFLLKGKQWIYILKFSLKRSEKGAFLNYKVI